MKRLSKAKSKDGVPLPSEVSINDSYVRVYSGFDDARLWLDSEAWIGDVASIERMRVEMRNFISDTFKHRINEPVFQLAASLIFDCGTLEGANPSKIVDSLCNLMNEMAGVVDDTPRPSCTRRPIGPFFSSTQFQQLGKTAKDRMPNVADFMNGVHTPKRDREDEDEDEEQLWRKREYVESSLEDSDEY